MMPQVTIEEVIQLAKGLSPLDKLHLIERLAPDLEAAIAPRPRKGLRGLFKARDISAKEIQDARREMWGKFPREDV